jgi:hypothetical protein
VCHRSRKAFVTRDGAQGLDKSFQEDRMAQQNRCQAARRMSGVKTATATIAQPEEPP